MATKRVTLRHPKLPEDQTITVSERSVPIHKEAGWREAPKKQQPEQS